MELTDWIIAGATVVIALYSWQVYRAAKLSAKREEEFRVQLRDLYQAITIATLLSRGTSAFHQATEVFDGAYAGKTPIFARDIPEEERGGFSGEIDRW